MALPLRLSIVQEKATAESAVPGDPTARLDALRGILLRESELAMQLREELLRQRGAVADGDAAAVDRGSDATSRLLLMMEEARQRRGDIVASLTGDANVPLDHLETHLGQPLPAAVESARLTLRQAAMDVSQEAAINRVVLRRAVEAGEAFLQDLFSGGATPTPTYGAAAPTPPPSHPGRLLDRKA